MRPKPNTALTRSRPTPTLGKRSKRLGDSIHAWAVMQAIPDPAVLPFEAFVPFAPIFENQGLPVVANATG